MAAVEYGLPPDLMVGAEATTQQVLWHLREEVWGPIWQKFKGAGVKILNLDTGCTWRHPDLKEPLGMRSFINGESAQDGNGHGSHTCGTHSGQNGIGVAPDSEFYVGKVLSNRGGGASSGIAAGIRWGIELGVDIITGSLGGNSPYEPTRQAIVEANREGILCNFSAGNAGYNGSDTIGFPAKFLESMAIGSINEQGDASNFSSGGRMLDIMAPGSNIISASHTGSGRRIMSGTSMSCPFFTGLCALIIEAMRKSGAVVLSGIEAWRTYLARFTKDKGAPGKDPRYGLGIPLYEDIITDLQALDVTTI